MLLHILYIGHLFMCHSVNRFFKSSVFLCSVLLTQMLVAVEALLNYLEPEVKVKGPYQCYYKSCIAEVGVKNLPKTQMFLSDFGGFVQKQYVKQLAKV